MTWSYELKIIRELINYYENIKMGDETMKTNIKKLVLNSLLLALGLLLHQLTPVLGLPIQPDMALTMLFIIMIINKNDYKSCLVSGIATGIFTAMTTKFPGGQVPNVIDKFITTNMIFILMFIIYKLPIISKLKESKQNLIMSTIILPIGTFISGVIFLLSAQVLVGLPSSFTALFMVAVFPSIFINSIAGMFLYKVLSISLIRRN